MQLATGAVKVKDRTKRCFASQKEAQGKGFCARESSCSSEGFAEASSSQDEGKGYSPKEFTEANEAKGWEEARCHCSSQQTCMLTVWLTEIRTRCSNRASVEFALLDDRRAWHVSWRYISQLALARSSVRGLCLRYGNRRQRSESTNNQSQHHYVSTGSWTAISEHVPTKTADQVRSVTSRLTNSVVSTCQSNCRCLAACAEAFHQSCSKKEAVSEGVTDLRLQHSLYVQLMWVSFCLVGKTDQGVKDRL